MAKQSPGESFYDQIKQILDEKSENVDGWRRWIGPVALTVAGAAMVAQAVLKSGLLQTGGQNGTTDGESSDEYLVSCRSCGDLVDEDTMEDGLCEDCSESDETSYCCGMMYTDGELFCRSCGDPL